VLTAYRNGADPYAGGQHRGIDIGASVGSTVVAATSGTITFAGVVGSSGLTVSERSADGRFDLSYLHLSSLAVHRGDTVSAGSPIAAVGTTGRRSVAAPHLHFGVREAGSRTAYRDPLDFLAPPSPASPPRPVPVPVPVAHPATGEPAPAAHAHPHPAHPAAAPRPVATPHPFSAPHTHPAPNPLPAPGSHPAHAHPAVSGIPHGPGRAATLPSPVRPAAPGSQPNPHALDGPPGSDPARGPSSELSPPTAATHHAHQAAHKPHGIDLGWLAACLGLVAAATALGHPVGTTRFAKRSHARIAGLLRPAPRRG
jgi:hypothetical protein